MNSTITKIENGLVSEQANSVFIAFYVDPYLHYRSHEDCKSWGDAWNAKVALLGVLCRWDATYGFVGGKVDAGETLIQAALRECKEEVGTVVKEEQLEIFCTHKQVNEEKGTEQNIHLFLCNVTPDEIYQIQKNATTAEHSRVENSGYNVIHMVESTFDTLKNAEWAGSGQNEIKLLLESGIIPKPTLEK